MFGRIAIATAALLMLGAAPADRYQVPKPPRPATEWAAQCEEFDKWDKPGPPFKIHGRTYYVGTCGITAILIASDRGHAIIDSGTEAGAEIVAANVAAMGLRITDVKALYMSHEHFDHVGGMAKLQALSGATLGATGPAGSVMLSGLPAKDDPQFGQLPKMAAVDKLERILPGDEGYSARTIVTPVFTPGHTPGALSWTWKSCEGKTCLRIVYADSLNPISAKGYRFSDHPEYVAQFRAGIDRIAALPCDILITPHPGSSGMRARILKGSLVDGTACRTYAEGVSKRLDARLAEEQVGK